jgi:hypothetical protein
MDESAFQEVWGERSAFREFLDDQIRRHPELFPQAITEGGYWLDGKEPESLKMPGVFLRRIRGKGRGEVYFVRPSFVMPYMTGRVMPYMTGRVEEVEKGLYLRSLGVPYEAVAYCFGRNPMFWYRLECRLGSNSLVGTTVRDRGQLPRDLVADEYHTTVQGTKVYTAVTAGAGVVLGVSVTRHPDKEGLRQAYGDFHDEARNVEENYAPRTVNTDGWEATRKAWRSLYPMVALLLCFLHGFLKVRDRCGQRLPELNKRIWEAYRAATAEGFRQRIQSLKTWCQQRTLPATASKAVNKLCNRADDYAVSYDHPNGHRTSNLVDRLMNLLDRAVHSGRRLHGHLLSAERRLRGWALLLNFRPFSRRHRYRCNYQNAAHRLNPKPYHPHWLHNLLVSASLGGFRA